MVDTTSPRRLDDILSDTTSTELLSEEAHTTRELVRRELGKSCSSEGVGLDVRIYNELVDYISSQISRMKFGKLGAGLFKRGEKPSTKLKVIYSLPYLLKEVLPKLKDKKGFEAQLNTLYGTTNQSGIFKDISEKFYSLDFLLPDVKHELYEKAAKKERTGGPWRPFRFFRGVRKLFPWDAELYRSLSYVYKLKEEANSQEEKGYTKRVSQLRKAAKELDGLALAKQSLSHDRAMDRIGFFGHNKRRVALLRQADEALNSLKLMTPYQIGRYNFLKKRAKTLRGKGEQERAEEKERKAEEILGKGYSPIYSEAAAIFILLISFIFLFTFKNFISVTGSAVLNSPFVQVGQIGLGTAIIVAIVVLLVKVSKTIKKMKKREIKKRTLRGKPKKSLIKNPLKSFSIRKTKKRKRRTKRKK